MKPPGGTTVPRARSADTERRAPPNKPLQPAAADAIMGSRG